MCIFASSVFATELRCLLYLVIDSNSCGFSSHRCPDGEIRTWDSDRVHRQWSALCGCPLNSICLEKSFPPPPMLYHTAFPIKLADEPWNWVPHGVRYSFTTGPLDMNTVECPSILSRAECLQVNSTASQTS